MTMLEPLAQHMSEVELARAIDAATAGSDRRNILVDEKNRRDLSWKQQMLEARRREAAAAELNAEYNRQIAVSAWQTNEYLKAILVLLLVAGAIAIAPKIFR